MIVLISNESIEVRFYNGKKMFFNTSTVLGDILSKSVSFNFENIEEGISIAKEYLDTFDVTKKIDILEYEKFRWEHQLSNGFDHPENSGNYVGSRAVYIYENNYLSDFFIAIFHYYIFSNYKLVRCAHCGKWFATKTLKKQFCDRISPCYGLIIENKKVLNSKIPCEKAVKTIKQRLSERKKSIYDKWIVEKTCDGNCDICKYDDCILGEKNSKCIELCNNYRALKKAIINSPTSENIIALHKYLYSDQMPKQERPNRRRGKAEQNFKNTNAQKQ